MAKKILKILILILILMVVAVLGYVLYLQLQYSRIPDNAALTSENPKSEGLLAGTTYSVMSYNIGFGAYSADYTFFMDTGAMLDGTPTQGAHGRAVSREAVLQNTQGAIEAIERANPDFVLLQEVDIASTRSHSVNQAELVAQALPDYDRVFAGNFHSAYLLYPFSEPHGSVESGLLTLSRYAIEESVRRSYPVSNNFVDKFFDLDRCFSVHRIAVDNGRYLILIHSHMSAYDEGGAIRQQQLDMLSSVMSEEYAQGNYVIVGGDFNHALGEAALTAFPTGQRQPEWVSLLTEDQLPQGFHIAYAENQDQVATCRGADIPYEPGVSYLTNVDGFLVSDNLQFRVQNIDTGFAYSDHNPVLMEFILN